MKIPTFIEKNYWVEMTTCSIRGRILGLKELYFHFCLNLVGCVSIFGIQQQIFLEFIRTRFHVVPLLCLKNYRIIASWITKQYKAFSANDPQIQGCS